MVVRARWMWSAAATAFEPLVAIPVLVALSVFGLVGGVSLWLILALVVLFGIAQQPQVQRWLSGGDLNRRLSLRVGLQVGLAGSVLYLIGWGPLVAFAFALVAVIHLRMFGAVAWRHSLVWTLATVGAGQAAIAAGWVHSYLPAAYAHAAGTLGAFCGAMFIRALGQSAEQREHAESVLRSREERFRALVQDSCDVVSVVDPDGRASYVSPAIEQVMGLRPEDVVGTDYRGWMHPDDWFQAQRLLAQAIADPGGRHRSELRLWHADGGLRWVELTVRNLLHDPAVAGLIAAYRDITEQRAIRERLAYDADHDPLTGLANRSAFLRELERAVIDDADRTRTVAVLFVDLDGFKEVNDTLGHHCGDMLIVAVAGMLRRSVRGVDVGSDVVGRLGGDEFGVVLTDLEFADNAITVAERLLTEMDQPVLIGGQEVYARASVGIAVAGPDSTGAAELLHNADIAMYTAKRRQTHSFQTYTDGPQEPITLASTRP